MLKMLQGPAFPGFGQRWPETPRLAAAQHQPQLPTKGNFTVDSILSLRSPTVPPDGGSWQPAAAALPPGLLSYYPSLYHLYTPQGAQAPQEQLGTPRGGYPCSDPRCMQGLCLSRSPSAPQLPLAPWRSGPCRTKRVRTVFTPDQLERLEQEFLRQQYMVGTERAALASILHLAETQVKVWFQNRRIKWRKQSLEQKKAKLSKCGALEPDPQEQTDDKASDDDNVEIEV